MTTIALNGIAVWFFNIANWIRRIFYVLRHAIIVEAVCDTSDGSNTYTNESKVFRFTHEGQEITTTLTESDAILQKIEKGQTVRLFWIPGKKRAMLDPYKTDKESRSTLLICDIVSVLSVIVMIIGFVLISSSTKRSNNASIMSSMLLSMIFVYSSILLMIIMSIIRKKLKDKTLHISK